MNFYTRALAALAAVGLLLHVSPSRAQAYYPQLSTKFELIEPVQSEIEGEQIDPYVGTVSYEVVDLEIPGPAGFDLRVGRSFNKNPLLITGVPFSAMNWELSVPRIYLNVPAEGDWCAHPVPGFYPTPPAGYAPRPWLGVTLSIPGEGVRSFVREMSQGDVTWMTRDLWKGTCIEAQGVANRGFKVTAPDGRVFIFDQGFMAAAENLPTLAYLPVHLVPTTVSDKHGNTLTYSYVGSGNGAYHVGSIAASDGRLVTFQYDDVGEKWDSNGSVKRLRSFTFEDRIWNFNYVDDGLHSVTRPDLAETVYTYVGEPEYTHIESVTLPNKTKVTYTHLLREWKFYITGGTQTVTRYAVKTRTREYPGVDGDTAGAHTLLETYSYQDLPGDKTQTEIVASDGTRKLIYDSGHKVTRGQILEEHLTDAVLGILQKTTYEYESIRQVGGYGGASPPPYAEYLIRAKSRRVERGSDVYLTTLSEFDPTFGFPKYIDEDGPDVLQLANPSGVFVDDVSKRRTTLLWLHDTTKWILGQPTSECVDDVRCKTWTYYPTGPRRLETASEFGIPSTYQYHSTGDIRSVENGLGEIFKYQDYLRGTPQLELGPASETLKSRVVRTNGSIESETDAGGDRTDFDVDLMGREKFRNEPSPKTRVDTEWTTPANRVETYNKSPNSADFIKEIQHDVFGEAAFESEKELTSPGTYKTRTRVTRRDVRGRVSEQSLWAWEGDTRKWRKMTYDYLGRVLTLTEPGSAVNKYDYLAGDVTQITRADTSKQLLTNQGFGAPDKALPVRYKESGALVGASFASVPITTDIIRNHLGKPVSEVRYGANLTKRWSRSFEYEEFEQLTRIADSSRTSVTNFYYNNAGQIWRRKDGTRDIRFWHDGLGNVKRKFDFNDESFEVKSEYWPEGTLKKLTHGGSVWNYEYYPDNSLKSESVSLPKLPWQPTGSTLNLAFLYERDGLGNVEFVTYPSGDRLGLLPNAQGWPSKMGTHLSGVQYYANGVPSSYTVQNYQPALQVKQELSGRNRISRIYAAEPGSSVNLFDRGYQYSKADNIEEVTDTAWASPRRLSYDQSSRLRGATQGASAWSYGIDQFDNLTTATAPGSTFSLPSNTANVPSAFGHNEFGEVTATPAPTPATYGYDQLGRLTSVTSTPASHTFKYDGRNTLYSASDSSGNTTYLLRAGDKLVAEVSFNNAAGKLAYSENHYLGDRMVSKLRKEGSTAWTALNVGGTSPFSTGASRKFGYLHDVSGSIVSGAGLNYQAQYAYDDWGVRTSALPSPSPDELNLQYTGEFEVRFGTRTLLMSGGTRAYMPSFRRFLSPDPVTNAETGSQEINHYAYAQNNPYRFVDKDGNTPLDIGFLAVDLVRLGVAVTFGGPVGPAAWDVAASAIGVLSPVPGTGVALKVHRAASLVDNVGDAAKLAKAAQFATNKQVGKIGEALAIQQLERDGHKIIATQVTFWTSEGKRVQDIVSKAPDGRIMATEVKTNGAVRTASQERKDGLIDAGEARMTSRKAGVDEYRKSKIVTNVLNITVPVP